MTDEAEETLHADIPLEMAGWRVDRVAASLFPDHSRTRIQRWIRDCRLLLDGAPASVRQRVAGGERVVLAVEAPPAADWSAEPVAFTVLHEDPDLLVVDKPAGLVVHPGAGNPRGTLVNGLVHREPALAALPRAGIVHRLDKDTTGLLVVARTLAAHQHLVAALERRSVSRDYVAIVHGTPASEGTIEAPIGRHRVHRTRMAVTTTGKPAVTRFRVVETYPGGESRLAVALETGRTHQIRVHLAHLGHPIVGDPVYGRSTPGPAHRFPRQALHATRLSLVHPRTGEQVAWESPLPEDIAALVARLHSRETGEGA